MHPEIILLTGEIEKAENAVLESFARLFSQDDFFNDISICCCRNGNKVLIRYLPDSKYAYFFHSTVNECLLYFAGLLYRKNENNLFFSYDVLSIASNLFSEKIEYFELFRTINWPGSDKGIKSFKALKDCSDILRNKVLEKKISIKEACEFHNYFKGGYDGFLNRLPERMSFSNTNTIIRHLLEHSKKENMTSKDLDRLNFGEDRIMDYFFNLRFPLYSRIRAKFILFVKKLGLPDNVKIIYDESFENPEYRIEINFKDMESLREKIRKIDAGIEKMKSVPDLFDHDNLFEGEYDK